MRLGVFNTYTLRNKLVGKNKVETYDDNLNRCMITYSETQCELSATIE